MKVILGKSLYVQKKDIIFLNLVDVLLPESIAFELDGINIENENEFVKIDDVNVIDFFMNLDFIVDYNLYRNITIDEYYMVDLDLLFQLKKMENEYERLVIDDDLKKLYLIDETKKIEYKRNEMMNILKFRCGDISVMLDSSSIKCKNTRYSRTKKVKIY